MKKVAVMTLPLFNGRQYNYGGVLQNYALVFALNKYGYDSIAIHADAKSFLGYIGNYLYRNTRLNFFMWQDSIPAVNLVKRNKIIRDQHFELFINDNIRHIDKPYYNYTKFSQTISDSYDYFVVGSDQVWSPLAVKGKDRGRYFLSFCDSKKRISYAASLACDIIPKEFLDIYKNNLKQFKALSVREKKGQELLHRIDIEADVNIDPVFLLNKKEWSELTSKYSVCVDHKYVLLYFLGGINESILNSLPDDLLIIDVMDKTSPYYSCGPGEFLWLIQNAEMVLTDSFHAVSFSIIFNTPFYVCKRNQKGMDHMWSRIDDLLTLFEMNDRALIKDYDMLNNNINFSLVDKKIEIEQQKTIRYFSESLK